MFALNIATQLYFKELFKKISRFSWIKQQKIRTGGKQQQQKREQNQNKALKNCLIQKSKWNFFVSLIKSLVRAEALQINASNSKF